MFKQAHDRSLNLNRQRTISKSQVKLLLAARIPAAAIDAAREDRRIVKLRAYTTEGLDLSEGDECRWQETAKHHCLDEWRIHPMELVSNTPGLPTWQGLDENGRVIAQG